ncbi:tetraacyldisaccharide 4'-kinase [Piscinibacter sp.]|uniref:tetraacyldisaccharide 4'-kinase n=1 Tax=Piscinibacter sp. TaxID=1903157 RepID=UPI002BB5F9E9|nr:tetraacyldisaccharide 4'-kinase [Albitalea sp.]HUG25151.1 tetraacyldisaccharide 4'-kinase [Albitalea sp.]
MAHADAVIPPAQRLPALERAWLSRGPLAIALLPLAALFGALGGLRRALYRLGWLRTQALPVPVVVVGNLIAGGAGKTPAVMAVVAALRARGFRPGVVSRGYGRRESRLVDVTADTPAAHSGDEPLLLHIRLRVPVVVGSDRVAAVRELLRLHPAVDVVVSDDGLQHLRLPRAAQVLVFDERGAGNGWLLPAGPLREPMPSRMPPRTVVLYNAGRPSTALPGGIAQRELAGVVELHDWWSGRPASREALQNLVGRPLVAAAGTARPGRFFEMLESAGLTVQPLPLPDHHGYATLPWPPGTPDVVVTEKDAVKLAPDRAGSTRVWVAPLDFRMDAALEQALFDLLPPRPAPAAGTAHPPPQAT